jgi:hypothetical protein
VDSNSKWIEAVKVPTLSSGHTVKELRKIFATFGLPSVVVSDNGTCFASLEFKTFMERNHIKHIFTPPYHPSSNGLAERAVQTTKKVISRMEGDLDTRLARFLLKYRSTKQSSTGKSPSEMMLNMHPRTALDNSLRPRGEDNYERNSAVHAKVKAAPRTFAMDNQRVYVKNFSKGPQFVPGRIVSTTATDAVIQLDDGKLVRRHHDHIKITAGGTNAQLDSFPEQLHLPIAPQLPPSPPLPLSNAQTQESLSSTLAPGLAAGEISSNRAGLSSLDTLPASPTPVSTKPSESSPPVEFNEIPGAAAGNEAPEPSSVVTPALNDRPKRNRRPPQRYAETV